LITVHRRLAIVLIGLLTSACALTGTHNPNTAAVVDDREVSTSDVQSNVDTIAETSLFRAQAQADASGQLLQQVQTQVVTALVRSQILAEVAERNDVAVSDADVRAAADEIIEELGGREEFERRLSEQGIPERLFLQQVRDRELQTALQEQIGTDSDLTRFVQDELANVTIAVNPRYGTWDADRLQVTAADPLAPEGASPPAAAP
jgi:SurA-like protein